MSFYPPYYNPSITGWEAPLKDEDVTQPVVPAPEPPKPAPIIQLGPCYICERMTSKEADAKVRVCLFCQVYVVHARAR